MQKVILGIVAMGLVFVGAYYWNSRNAVVVPKTATGAVIGGPNSEVPVGTTLYYGAECPHCKDVEQYLTDNKVADKVKYDMKEVWHDKANAAIMEDRAKLCGLDVNKIGVPFLFAEGKCYVGTPDVEAYFKKAAGL